MKPPAAQKEGTRVLVNSEHELGHARPGGGGRVRRAAMRGRCRPDWR